MMKSTIKVLVVDDSEFLRKNLPLILESDPGIRVVGTASTGFKGVELARQLRPDVITMDVIMPGMNGLDALKVIMKEIPTPVVMLSSRTYQGAEDTVEALTLGAVDFITKPSGQVSLDISKIRKEIIDKVKRASCSKARPLAMTGTFSKRFKNLAMELSGSASQHTLGDKKKEPEKEPRRFKVIGIAASTGGPMALQRILTALPENYPIPICIVQHIGVEFVSHMVQRFDSVSKLGVKAAGDGEILCPGNIYFSPGREHLTVIEKKGVLHAKLNIEPAQASFRPSADELFWSLGSNLGRGKTCGIIMTGMGDDGSFGLKRLKESGGYTIAQNEETCTVFGMPKQAIESGVIKDVLSLDEIINKLLEIAL